MGSIFFFCLPDLLLPPSKGMSTGPFEVILTWTGRRLS